jgi:hypothetical protein
LAEVCGVGVAFLAEGFACGAEGFATLESLAASAGVKAAESFRTTGASTVEDADLTNSPMSFNLSRTVLLSTPNRFANS